MIYRAGISCISRRKTYAAYLVIVNLKRTHTDSDESTVYIIHTPHRIYSLLLQNHPPRGARVVWVYQPRTARRKIHGADAGLQ